MARRKPKHKIDKKVIIEAFAEMAKHKSIDRDLLQGILEETLSMIIRKKYGQESKFEIIVNMEKGDIEIYLMREIVDVVEDEVLQIAISDARKYSDEEYEIGDEFIEEITLDNISESFGRRLVTLASQNLNQRIREVEKDNVFREYIDKVGEIIIGEIYQVRRHDILVVHNKIEMRLPREEQIPNEPYRYKKNQTIKALIKEVNRSGAGGQPEVILSRASEDFLARLFEIEIPEIYDGIIQIKSIARDPGERSKVAVVSFDDRVDPVGACVGMKGIRIHSIVRELNNENIDLIEYTEDINLFIARALSPAKVDEIELSTETRTANVTVKDDQVALAVGKNGQNVRLASKLTGYNILLTKLGDEDIELTEFLPDMGKELYDLVFDTGIETAREFLEANTDFLLTIPGMTKEKLVELRQIMLVEFDEHEQAEILEAIKNFKPNQDIILD
ncbi:MAG: transcription termination factor NusA [Candidatus Kapabacteria bacterium]|nr:transcription termination factor NusA [Candidatus Kapabacteria bacterium]